MNTGHDLVTLNKQYFVKLDGWAAEEGCQPFANLIIWLSLLRVFVIELRQLVDIFFNIVSGANSHFHNIPNSHTSSQDTKKYHQIWWSNVMYLWSNLRLSEECY